jgi:hypothetical protein
MNALVPVKPQKKEKKEKKINRCCRAGRRKTWGGSAIAPPTAGCACA